MRILQLFTYVLYIMLANSAIQISDILLLDPNLTESDVLKSCIVIMNLSLSPGRFVILL